MTEEGKSYYTQSNHLKHFIDVFSLFTKEKTIQSNLERNAVSFSKSWVKIEKGEM